MSRVPQPCGAQGQLPELLEPGLAHPTTLQLGLVSGCLCAPMGEPAQNTSRGTCPCWGCGCSQSRTRHIHGKLHLRLVLLSSSRRAEVTGKTGRVLVPQCVCWAPQVQGSWSWGWFESVTFAGAGESGCQGRAGGAWGVSWVENSSLLFICCVLALHQVSDSSGALPIRLVCFVVLVVGARGDASGSPHPASRCRRAGGSALLPEVHRHLLFLPNYARSNLDSTVV